MASTCEVKLISAGVRSLLKSGEVAKHLTSMGNDVAHGAGEGFEVVTHGGRNRSHIVVYPGTLEAARENMKNNSLLKALGRR